jgi:hypothetical protein
MAGGTGIQPIRPTRSRTFRREACFSEPATAATCCPRVAAAPRRASREIVGASKRAELEENLAALEVLPELDASVLERIESMLEDEPKQPERYRRRSQHVAGGRPKGSSREKVST